MSSNAIKTEDGAFIKPEHEADGYEDTGECHMPGNPEEQRAWLCRLPKWLWTAWEDMADDEEIELGKIRVYHKGNPDGTSRVRMKLHDLPKHHDVPKLYDLTTTRAGYSNTVVFSERDQPGFKAWNPNRVRKDGQRNTQYKVNKNKPYTSSIPSMSLPDPPPLSSCTNENRTNRSRRLCHQRDGRHRRRKRRVPPPHRSTLHANVQP